MQSEMSWLDDLAALEAAATKGPWDGVIGVEWGGHVRAPNKTNALSWPFVCSQARNKDAALIAAARNALPRLLALARAALNIENYLENAGSFEDNPLAESHIRTFIEQAKEVDHA